MMQSSYIIQSVFISTLPRQALKRSWYHQVTCCQFLFLHPQLVYPPEKYFYGVIFHTSSSFAERLDNELLSSCIKFKYNTKICCNNLSLFWYPSVELLSVVTISLSIDLLHFLHTILVNDQWFIFYLSFNIIIHQSDLIWELSSNFKFLSLLL